MKTYRVGTRKSRLALAQVDEIQQLLLKKGVHVSFERVLVDTQGDLDKKTSLLTQPADDFFTDTIEEAHLAGTIDVSIHSAKDLPKKLKQGLTIAALTEGLDETDCFVGRVKFADLPPGAEVGTSSLIRQKEIKALNPHIETVDIRGTIEDRLALVEQGVYDGIIVATVALKRLGLTHRITDIMPWEAMALQGQLAVVVREEDKELGDYFSTIDVRKRYGKVILVGAGPGDPELITVKGVEALKKSQCVFYDYLIDTKLLDYAPAAEKIYAGKRKGAHTLPQRELSKMVRLKAQEGKNVVRLKGGDPLIFGRGAEEIEYLRNYHIDVEVIPGLSSATSIPSRLGIPLTARDISSSVAFLSGHGKEESREEPLDLVIPKADSLIFLMGITKLPQIVQALLKAGWRETTPIIVVSNGTKPDEQIVSGTLKDIVEEVNQANLKPPALILVGETVKFYNPPKGSLKKILYTGTNPDKYNRLGDILHWPMIEVARAAYSSEQLKEWTAKLLEYDIIFFTSRFGVEYFFDYLKEVDFDVTRLQKKVFATIGRDTYNVLFKRGFEAAIVPEIETGRGLLEAIKQKLSLRFKRILFPRSALPNPFLKSELEKLGAVVDELIVYENHKPVKKDLPQAHIEEVIFTSPSTVVNFLEDYKKIPKEWKIISKGTYTQEALKSYGYESEVLIDESF